MTLPLSKPLRVGEVLVDPDGARWIIVAVTHEDGEPRYSRVREGSPAAEVHGYPAKEESA